MNDAQKGMNNEGDYEPEEIYVGEEFPRPLPQTSQKGLYPLLSDESLLIPILMCEVAEGELEEFGGPMMIGAAVKGDVPFFMIRYQDGWCLDGSINPYNYDLQYRQDFVNGKGNSVPIVVTEGLERTVRHIRVVGLKHEMMDLLRDGYQACMETHDDSISVNREVQRVYTEHPTSAHLMDAADITQEFNDK